MRESPNKGSFSLRLKYNCLYENQRFGKEKRSAKFVKREVKKKAGYEVDIQLNEFTATVTDGTAHVHLNVDAELGKDELTKLLAAIGL